MISSPRPPGRRTQDPGPGGGPGESPGRRTQDPGPGRGPGARARLAILLSGRGSNFLALHAAVERGEVPAEIVLVLSDVPEAPGLARARELGLPAAAVPRRGAGGRAAHEAAVSAALQEAEVEWICLAGYMRVLSAGFVDRFPRRILNVHPSLLPAFPGLDAQRQAWEHGVRVAGCTVHLVDAGVDTGPIVEQRAVRVREGDNPQRLAERILAEEHRAYPAALRRLLTEPWRVEGRRVVFAPEGAAAAGDREASRRPVDGDGGAAGPARGAGREGRSKKAEAGG